MKFELWMFFEFSLALWPSIGILMCLAMSRYYGEKPSDDIQIFWMALAVCAVIGPLTTIIVLSDPRIVHWLTKER